MQVSRLAVVALASAGCLFGQSPEVEKIFRTRCFACHGSAQQISGLRLDQRDAALAGGYSGPVIVPGKSGESKLFHRVSGKPGVLVMPPSGPRLSASEVDTIAKWIDSGAKWAGSGAAPVASANPKSQHWAFQPVRPPAADATIDGFIRARLKKEGFEPSPEADKRTLLRRLSLDLTGLPPTPEEMRAFLADTREDAYERQVDRLLASPHFGERWARPWLDRARYADSDGYEKDWDRPWAWRYRDWVIRALNSDLPFDQFTMQQVAGDLMPDTGLDGKIAAGFHRNTLTNREGGIDNKQFLFEAAIDRSNTVASAWLGMTVACSQCHDHKYDPISQKDFYSLYAFFDNMREVDADAPLAGEIGPWLQKRDEYRAKRAELLQQYNVAALQTEWEKEMLRASAKPGERTDWDLAWDCLLKLTEGGADGERIMRIPAEKRTEREADTLTTHFIRNYHFAVGQKKWKELKLDELDKKLRELRSSYPQLSEMMTVEDGPRTGPSHLRVRGDYQTMGIEVQPNTLSVLPALKPASQTATRLDLAKWLVARENPLTARVAVNWMWQELFGRGIVKTAEDFGTRGEAPSHPELLDYLAYKFVDDGWSMKRLIRSVVVSASYRQSSKARPDVAEKDPDDALLARFPRVRLPAELIRDEALSVSGLLTGQVGGPSVRPPQPAGVASLAYGASGDAKWAESKGADRYRRGLYIFFQRATPYPLLMNFDAPKAVVTQCRRERSNTSLQALNLLNDPVFVEAAAALAYRVMGETTDTDTRIRTMFELALARTPSLGEAARFRKGFELLRARYAGDAENAAKMAPATLPGVARDEAAAWVNLASVLLNLDEFITKE
jgi:hypothetical protein